MKWNGYSLDNVFATFLLNIIIFRFRSINKYRRQLKYGIDEFHWKIFSDARKCKMPLEMNIQANEQT